MRRRRKFVIAVWERIATWSSGYRPMPDTWLLMSVLRSELWSW